MLMTSDPRYEIPLISGTGAGCSRTGGQALNAQRRPVRFLSLGTRPIRVNATLLRDGDSARFISVDNGLDQL
jgi:hypothetical protein